MWIIDTILITAMVVMFAVMNRRTKRFNRQMEYFNTQLDMMLHMLEEEDK